MGVRELSIVKAGTWPSIQIAKSRLISSLVRKKFGALRILLFTPQSSPTWLHHLPCNDGGDGHQPCMECLWHPKCAPGLIRPSTYCEILFINGSYALEGMRFTRTVCKITPEFLIHWAESPGGSKESVGQEGGRRARLGLHHTVCGPLSGLGIVSKGNGSHSRVSIRGNGIYWSFFISRTAEFAFPASSRQYRCCWLRPQT